jgi:DNA-binding SARP family transcriptional activator
VIVLSAKSTHQDILTALEKGADDFIPKPFDLEDLLLRVRVWLDRTKLAETQNTTLRIFTLGPFRAFLGMDLVLNEELGDPRAKQLLKYLCTRWEEPVPRAHVLYLLWPDLDERVAEKHLSGLLQSLRALLRDDLPNHAYVQEDGCSLRLDSAADLWVDAREFEVQARSAQEAQEAGDTDVALGLFLSALALYKEDYLRENLYEDWPSDRRERLRELWISSMFRVAAICGDRCEYADSVRLMKKVLEIDSYRENAYQALMLYLSRAGRRGEAIQLYRYAETVCPAPGGAAGSIDPNAVREDSAWRSRLICSVEDARQRILARFAPLGEEVVTLDESRGRILATAITAGFDLPPFANSSMDGFAVRGPRPSERARQRHCGCESRHISPRERSLPR